MKNIDRYNHDPGMRSEYDFSKGIRGKYANRYGTGKDLTQIDESKKSDTFNPEDRKLKDLRWNGKPVNEYKGNLAEIRDSISVFEKQPFKINASENEYSDVVINTSDGGTPIAVVSKSYSLVQHRDILNSIDRAFRKLEYNIDETECNLYLTKYSESMWLRIQFMKGSMFDPGDGHLLIPQLHVRNSVDGSTPLGFELGWYRLICKNGLMCLNTNSRFSKRHTISLKSEQFTEYLDESISKVQSEKETYTRWKQKKLDLDTDGEMLQNWVDTVISKKWGYNLAERAYNILITARDGKITRFKEKGFGKKKNSYMIRISSEFDVPGAQPAENMYDVANALSWLSSHQNSLQTQYRMMGEVPEMLQTLEKSFLKG